MHAQVLFVLATALTLAVAADKPKEKEQAKKDLEKLQGTWVMAELEVNGALVPPEKIKGTTLVIKGDKYIVKVKDQTHQTTFKLDPSQKPRAIDMYFPAGPDSAPKLSKGVYELDGDTFKLCRHQMPGQDRPTQLGSWPNTNLFVVTWNRQAP
jgi:uncharacterized protein (TIGR03067 family)